MFLDFELLTLIRKPRSS
ncbi:rCG22612 [Rattus norvegicus]|uniref:RCG22612 n=1 Tax=Rattus norvegicus TaxID=10116 RepID=A6KNS6_RAT|nr:rCG22612 [Rattus norvegicus]